MCVASEKWKAEKSSYHHPNEWLIIAKQLISILTIRGKKVVSMKVWAKERDGTLYS